MKVFTYFFGLVLIVSIVSLFFYVNALKPVDQDSKKINFSVDSGDTLSQIAANLSTRKLIKNKYVFMIHSRVLGLSNKLQSGNFRLSTSMATADIIKTLASKGTKDIWIRIPEGSRNEELDLPYQKEEFLVKSKTGDIFPDSYLVPDYYNLDEFLSLVRKNYLQKAGKLKLSPNDIILASLIEREGKTLEDKKIIAGILKNRLIANMPLQVDASAQYARDSMRPYPAKFWLPPSSVDLKIKSAYNTYLNLGLPPTPICNPSLNSLIASVNPTQSDFLFYIHDRSGQPHYAQTLDEHNSNILKYLK